MASQQLDEEAIFHVARDLSNPAVRAAYLNQVCTGGQSLRERVEGLLEVHEKEQSFLRSDERLNPETAETQPSSEIIGELIGRYRLMEQIGEGGMGTVFVAQQDRPIRRKVALKVVKPGMDTKAVLARFEAERQALAVMDHTNIARVFDAGSTDQGRPYFVMELVRGVPITDYCDESRLSIEQRLELFASICQAIQHAHQKGIIHRDIKPSNVLVTELDGNPVPKVIDFGVAKAINQDLIDRTLSTSHHAVVGTPLYMSPEQANLSAVDVDTRSDVYSLGVLLYELLTGTTPIEKQQLQMAAHDEVLRIIREQDPPRPSNRISTLRETATKVPNVRRSQPDRLRRLVKGDLDWIVMKALEKDRNRRYESPASLADDVGRVLGDEPVEACPPSRSYRVRKFTRRNRVLVTTATIVTFAMVCGLGLALWGRSRAVDFARIAQEEQRKAQTRLRKLQEELLNQAFELAFAGDLAGVEDALERASDAEAPEHTRLMIQGIAHLYAGDPDRAVGILDGIVEDRPDDLAAVCAASWANFRASRFDAAGRLYSRIGELAEVKGGGDHSLLLLSQVKVYGTTDLPGLIRDLDGLIKEHPRWGIAYVLRARAKSQHFLRTQSFDDARSAAEDAIHANRLLYNNPYVVGVTLEIYASVIELAIHLGEDTTPYERYADEIVKQVDNWPRDLQVRQRRLIYYLVTEHEDYATEKQKLLDEGWAFTQPQLAELIQQSDRSKLQRFVGQHSSRRTCQIALALDAILHGERERGLELHEELAAETEAFNTRLLMLDIPAIAQRPDLAAAAAKRLLDDLPGHDPAHYWRFEVTCARYWSQEPKMSDEQLLNLAGPHHIERSVAHYFIGMRAIAEGDTVKAKEHLAITSATSPAGWWYDSFSKAYIKLIDDGRIPIQAEAVKRLTSEEHSDD